MCTFYSHGRLDGHEVRVSKGRKERKRMKTIPLAGCGRERRRKQLRWQGAVVWSGTPKWGEDFHSAEAPLGRRGGKERSEWHFLCWQLDFLQCINILRISNLGRELEVRTLSQREREESLSKCVLESKRIWREGWWEWLANKSGECWARQRFWVINLTDKQLGVVISSDPATWHL